MTAMLIRIDTSTADAVDIDTRGGGSSSSQGGDILIPESQRYYWSRTWQAEEQTARMDRLAGRTHEFVSADDAIAWLLSDD